MFKSPWTVSRANSSAWSIATTSKVKFVPKNVEFEPSSPVTSNESVLIVTDLAGPIVIGISGGSELNSSDIDPWTAGVSWVVV
jgi:hypothetical protein